MKYVQAYGRWIVFLFLIWGYIYIDSTYDFHQVPPEFTTMQPVVQPETHKWVMALNSMKDVKRGRTIVQYRRALPWGPNKHITDVYIYGRVVALAGDYLQIKKGVVYVNGEKIDTGVDKVAEADNFQEFIIPRGHIYVLSNARTSLKGYRWDSRMLGPIPFASVTGYTE